MIDLGKWASEAYSIPAADHPDDDSEAPPENQH